MYDLRVMVTMVSNFGKFDIQTQDVFVLLLLSNSNTKMY